jgi:hypothetical protein
MSPIAIIRRLRWLPQVLLAAIVLAVAQTSLLPCAMAGEPVAASMSEHCMHCPPVAAHIGDDCAYRHAPQINAFDNTAHHVAMLVDSPLLQSAPFNVHDLRRTQVPFVIVDYFPSPPRPLHLTHCVQLK